MTRVVDSSAWIEWVAENPLARTLDREIPDPDECVVPTIVQFEMMKWLSREVSRKSANEFVAFTQQCLVVALDTRIALRAAALSREHKLPTADAIIYATTIDQGADLLTCDAHFEGLAGVLYFAKTVN